MVGRRPDYATFAFTDPLAVNPTESQIEVHVPLNLFDRTNPARDQFVQTTGQVCRALLNATVPAPAVLDRFLREDGIVIEGRQASGTMSRLVGLGAGRVLLEQGEMMQIWSGNQQPGQS